MDEHTKGKLEVTGQCLQGLAIQSDVGDDHFRPIVAIAIGPHRGQVDQRTHDDARRLVAAWNAVEGISTEDLEILRIAVVDQPHIRPEFYVEPEPKEAAVPSLMTVEEARAKRVCRICEKTVWGTRPVTVETPFGAEFAHADCLLKQEQAKEAKTNA